jgi:hypothetical protein
MTVISAMLETEMETPEGRKMLLSIADLQRKSVADVSPGTLVLFRHGSVWLRALKVVGPGDDEEERQALVVMPFESRSGQVGPVLFREIGHEKCLVLGQPVAWWTGDPAVIVPGSELDRKAGYLQLRPEGITILVSTIERYSDVGAWYVADGQPARIATEHPLIVEWCLGILDAEGKAAPFVSYPKDFAAAKAK